MGLLDVPCRHCDGTCDKMIVAVEKPLAERVNAPVYAVPYDEKVKVSCRIEAAQEALLRAPIAQDHSQALHGVLGAIFGPDTGRATGRLSAVDPMLQRIPKNIAATMSLSELERYRNSYYQRMSESDRRRDDDLREDTIQRYNAMAMTDSMFGKMWITFRDGLTTGPGEHLTESVVRTLLASTAHLFKALDPELLRVRARALNRDLVETMEELVRGLREAHSRGDVAYLVEALEEAEAVLSEIGEPDARPGG